MKVLISTGHNSKKLLTNKCISHRTGTKRTHVVPPLSDLRYYVEYTPHNINMSDVTHQMCSSVLQKKMSPKSEKTLQSDPSISDLMQLDRSPISLSQGRLPNLHVFGQREEPREAQEEHAVKDNPTFVFLTGSNQNLQNWALHWPCFIPPPSLL